MDSFGDLDTQQRDSLITYIQGCTDSDDCKARISNVIRVLEEGAPISELT